MGHTFDTYFTHMNDLAVCRDAERRIVSVNPAFTNIFGGNPEDWTDRHFDGAVSGARIGAFHDNRAYGQVLAQGRTYWVEWDEAPLPQGGSIAIGRINADRRTAHRAAEAPERDRRRNKSSVMVPATKTTKASRPAPPPATLPPVKNPPEAPATSVQNQSAPASAAPTPNHTRILLVEDDPLSAKLAMALLGRENCTVIHVSDGNEALDLARTQIFDLVFMDMRMPKMDGPSACRAIRALGGPWKDIPIIALTANAFEEDRKACLAAGMTGFVTKPIDAQTLLAVRERWTLSEKQAKLA
jgi:CheY-like chemotaxis protein